MALSLSDIDKLYRNFASLAYPEALAKAIIKAINAAAGTWRPDVIAMDAVDITLPSAPILIDGVTIANGNRVLFTALTNPLQNNRVFRATNISATTIDWIPQMDGGNEDGSAANGDILFVVSGTSYGNQFRFFNGINWAESASEAMIGLIMPDDFNVAGSPVDGSGTFTVTYKDQPANTMLAGPTSGPNGIPEFRAPVPADIPPINLAAGGQGGVTGNLPVTNLGSGTGASDETFWRGDGTWDAPNSFEIIQADSGTSPTATSPGDTLSFHNSDGQLDISGDAPSKTITINASPLIGFLAAIIFG